MASWWEPIDVLGWSPYASESRGKRPKHWFQDPEGRIWLRKQPPPIDLERPHTARRSEPAIEVFALELARRLGLPTAVAHPATWNGERGVVSLRFHDVDEVHHPGAELLGLPGDSGKEPEAKARRDQGRAAATLEAVRNKLREIELERSVSLLEPFTRILVVDAWLGNGDRHSGNWAVVFRSSSDECRLAPMYDPTACLGVELTDDRPQLAQASPEQIRQYADRCPSGFGGGHDGRTGVPMREILPMLATWPEWAPAVSELRPKILSLLQEVPSLVAEIPDDWLSPNRKRFAHRVLEHRVTLLL